MTFGIWPGLNIPKPDPHVCEWHELLFNVYKDCDQDGTVHYDGHWYCKEHVEGAKEGKNE
jgi:hypothetical protein